MVTPTIISGGVIESADGGIRLPGYASAAMPVASLVRTFVYKTDGARGVWCDDGSAWWSVTGEICNAKEHGCKGDGTTDDRTALNTLANTTLSGGGMILFPPGTYKISSNITTANNVGLWFMPGAKISADNSVTVTIGFVYHAKPTQQIFAGAGSFVLSAGSCQEVFAEWWGIDGTSDEVEILAALTAAGRCDLLRNKTYTLGANLLVPTGAWLRGQDLSTKVKAAASFNGTLISVGTAVSEYTKVTLENFTVDLTTAGTAAVGIDKRSCNQFEMKNIYIDGLQTANTQIGFKLQNGTHCYYEDLRVNGTQIPLRMINPSGSEAHDSLFNKIWLSPTDQASSICIYNTGGYSGSLFLNPYFETGSVAGQVGIKTDDGLAAPFFALINPWWDGTFAWFIQNLVTSASRMTIVGGTTLTEGVNCSGIGQANILARQFSQAVETFQVLNSNGNVAWAYDSTGMLVGAGGARVVRILKATATWDPGSLATGVSDSVDVAVANANEGDACWVGFSCKSGGVAQSGIQLSANCYTGGTVKVTVTNNSGSPINLDSKTLTVWVIQ